MYRAELINLLLPMMLVNCFLNICYICCWIS